MVVRLWEWWRARRTLVDAAFLVPLAFLEFVSAPAVLHDPIHSYNLTLTGYLLLSTALLVPMVWRRRWPRVTFAAVALVSFVQWTMHTQMLIGNTTVLMGLYTVTAYCSFRWSLAALAVTELGVVLETYREWGGALDKMRGPLVAFTAISLGVWVLGLHMRTRRAYLRQLEERADRLEHERDAEIQLARNAERARIAREMHDVVAHNVSVIVVQADGAAYAIETDPGRARQALETISTTGRTALAEMRRLLGVLREESAAGAYAPQPGLAQLDDLVEQVRAAGLPVTLERTGRPAEVSEGRALAVYRIVQEALTNTLKHGGPRASATVTLHYGDDEMTVAVVDDGRGAAAPDDGHGHGLVGMRERAAVYGGVVEAAPRDGGGFAVTARIPVREEART
ncbi:sensor histidine kinase [Actinomadura rupiterrae]|uniref:sensor histidine kinase n=1 Tax=Actinomadura rupiterrae TaxID=559627 RepID=UPI0020A3A278|nr:sensor histidine kinase [Actinomadura rupiterrae]MCP2342880.1 signal transduction histidine kinase [Actinomadura rupiterrae]